MASRLLASEEQLLVMFKHMYKIDMFSNTKKQGYSQQDKWDEILDILRDYYVYNRQSFRSEFTRVLKTVVFSDEGTYSEDCVKWARKIYKMKYGKNSIDTESAEALVQLSRSGGSESPSDTDSASGNSEIDQPTEIRINVMPASSVFERTIPIIEPRDTAENPPSDPEQSPTNPEQLSPDPDPEQSPPDPEQSPPPDPAQSPPDPDPEQSPPDPDPEQPPPDPDPEQAPPRPRILPTSTFLRDIPNVRQTAKRGRSNSPNSRHVSWSVPVNGTWSNSNTTPPRRRGRPPASKSVPTFTTSASPQQVQDVTPPHQKGSPPVSKHVPTSSMNGSSCNGQTSPPQPTQTPQPANSPQPSPPSPNPLTPIPLHPQSTQPTAPQPSQASQHNTGTSPIKPIPHHPQSAPPHPIQPIQPTTRPAPDPLQPTNHRPSPTPYPTQPIQPTNHRPSPTHRSTQRIQTTPRLAQSTHQPIQPTPRLAQSTHQQTQPTPRLAQCTHQQTQTTPRPTPSTHQPTSNGKHHESRNRLGKRPREDDDDFQYWVNHSNLCLSRGAEGNTRAWLAELYICLTKIVEIHERQND